MNVSRLEGTDSQESSEPAELPIGFFERQVRSGVRTGKVVGLLAAAGTFAIVATTRTEPDDPAIELVDLTYTLVVGLLGYAAGSAVGVHRYSAAQGIRSPFLATAAGALGGLIIGLPLGGILSLYTAPRGAAWAHNAMHRHSSGRL